MSIQSTLAQRDPDLLVVPRLRYYSAGRIQEASLWRGFTAETTKIDIVNNASWIALPDAEDPNSDFPAIWVRDLEEVRQANVVTIGSTLEGPLRGALVEVGAALGQGKPVLVIGSHHSFSSWQHHPLCVHVIGLEDALTWLDSYAKGLNP